MKRNKYAQLFVSSMLFVLWLCCTGAIARMDLNTQDYSLLWRSYKSKLQHVEPSYIFPYDECFRSAAKEYHIPLTLLLAVARGESDFNPSAKSSANCYGIMQIQWPGTAKDLGFSSIKQLYDPCRNITAGAKYLAQLLKRYKGNINLTLAAYNYGLGRIAVNAASLPEGASWYSGYIYHHLTHGVLLANASSQEKQNRGFYHPSGKLKLIKFYEYYHAVGFFEYLTKQEPTLRLDMFDDKGHGIYIVLLFDDRAELNREIKLLNENGYYPDPDRVYR